MVTYRSAHAGGELPPKQPRGTRRWMLRLLSGLVAFGVFGAVGGYYVPRVLDKIGTAVSRPLSVDVFVGEVEQPTYVFPDSVQPAEVATDVLNDAHGRLGSPARMLAKGAVFAHVAPVRVVVRGRNSNVIHLEDVRVRVVSQSPPLEGWFNTWRICETGAVDPRTLSIDGEHTETPPVWYIDGQAVGHPAFTVSGSDEEVFDVAVRAKQHEVSWVIEIEYSSVDSDGTLRVDDHGAPFRVTGTGNAQAWAQAEKDRLERAPDRDGDADAGCHH
jgi:hypothetical protein